MRSWVGLVVLLLAMAGCGAPSGQDADAQGGTGGLGAIRGIVVDDAIRPIAKAELSVALPAGNRTTLSDGEGRFEFRDMAPGSYFVRARHLLYETAQVAADVVAGAEPPVTKLQMKALFTKKPYHEQVKFDGFIECGYEAAVLTAPCVTDYTSILPTCPGGCVPPLRQVQDDKRSFATRVGPDWQTMVLELTFQANGQGTSDRMGLLISYERRTASEWFGRAEGRDPVVLRLEVGKEGPGAQGDARPRINATGDSDLVILGSIQSAEGQDAGVGVSQTFQVFQTNFYNAKPPEGWSFVKGDDFPF